MEDLMRAKDILGAVKRNKERIDPAEEDGGVITGYRLAHDQITEIINRCIPTVLDVKPVVRGKWRLMETEDTERNDTMLMTWGCTNCGSGYKTYGSLGIEYCPHCGADMREEQQE